MIKLSRWLQIFVATSLFVSVAVGVQGESQDPGGRRGPIRVGIYTNYPIVFEKGGDPTGFHLELLKAVARQEGWTVAYQFPGALKNVVRGLEAGTMDLGLGVVPTDANRQLLDFTKEKNAVLTGRVFVPSGRGDIRAMSDLEGKTVACINQEAMADELIATSAKLRINPLVRWVNSYEELAEAVATGGVDAGLFSELQGKDFAKLYQIEPTPIVFKPNEVQFAVAKGKNPAIIAALDRYLHSWKLSQLSPYYELEREFMGDRSEGPAPWTKRQIMAATALCLLLLVFGVILGNLLASEAEASSIRHSKVYIRHIAIFVGSITLAFWVLDSMIGWLLFNAELKMNLLEWTATKVPAENLYIRGMLFMVCCVFGIYLVRYIGRYEAVLHLLMVNLKRFEQLADNARDMIFRMSLPSGRYEFVSKAASEIFGYTPQEFYSRPLLIKELIHQDWQGQFSRQWDDLLSGDAPPSYEYQVITKAGETRWINQRNTVYRDETGRPIAIEGIVTDMTEQRRTALGRAH